MGTWDDVKKKLASVWPDVYVGIVLAALAFISILDDRAGSAVSIGKLLGGGVGIAYLVVVCAASLGLAASVTVRQPLPASRFAGALAVLLVLNGGAVYMNDPGTASKLALGVYLSLGVLMTNRCIVLAYAVVVPSWLQEAVAREARKRER